MDVVSAMGWIRSGFVLVFVTLGIFVVPAAAAPSKAARAEARAQELEALRRKVETLTAQLGDADPARRGAAAIDLAAIRDRRVVPMLFEAIKTAPAERRLALLQALRRFKVAAKIAPLIALARELDYFNLDPLRDEVQAQLRAVGPRAAAPLFAVVSRCAGPADAEDYNGPPRSNAWRLTGFLAETAGGIGPSVLPRILREAAAPSRCRRWAAMQALDEFTGLDKPWYGEVLDPACAALVRATKDRDGLIRDEATRVLEQRREVDVCTPPDTHPFDWRARATREESRQHAFEEALASTDPSIRRGAIDRLLDTTSEDDVIPMDAKALTSRIAPLVSDADDELRLKAIKTLHRINARATSFRDEETRDPEGSVPVLLEALHDTNAAVRHAALEALVEVTPRGPSPWQVSMELLSLIEEADDETFATIQSALSELYDPAIAPRLVDLLTHKDIRIRLLAAYVLEQCGSAAVTPRLAPLLKDADADVRRTAAHTIRELVSLSYDKPIPDVLAALVVPMLAALDDADPAIRQSAIDVLGWTKDPRALAPLIRMLPITTNDTWCQACSALGRLGHPGAIEALRPYLTHDNPKLRLSAASALGGIKDDRAAALLKIALRDPDVDVRAQVVKSLAEVGRPSAIEAVRREALADADKRVRITAVYALRAYPGPETVATLVRMLKDPDAEARQAAGWLLRDIARPEAVPALIEALTDEDPRVRGYVAETLGNLGDRRAVEPLRRVLPHVPLEAAQALTQIGIRSILDALCDSASMPTACRAARN